ncbi:hypothetical protein scyTo_0022264, partial [Scyliorhinus torazame]|nr:hypothetical protein [Scyliorhinus torazame]
FELKKGQKMCADPQIAWAKLLMARIEKVNKGGSAKNNRPQKQSSVGDTAPKIGTTTRSTPSALSSRRAAATHREDTDIPVDSTQ